MSAPGTVHLQIDGRDVAVAAGATVLDAARGLGIDIPTLCFLTHDLPTRPSCMACLVRVNGEAKFSPSCATIVREGMCVESETADVHAARRSAMELLFSDHLGDCVPVCQRVCPAHLQIPAVIRLVAAGKLDDAIALVKEHIALPGVVGRLCRAICENGCRRGKFDGSVSIRMIEQHVADIDLAADRRYVPECAAASGKRVAIVGSGPTGLAAAFYLLRLGHPCTVYDAHAEPGGLLRYGVPDAELPRAVLDGEIEVISQMGMEFRANARLGGDITLDELRAQYDAVVLAVGVLKADQTGLTQLAVTARGLRVDAGGCATSVAGVFAAGAAVHGRREIAQALGDGRVAALAVHAWLSGAPAPHPAHVMTSTIPKLAEAEYAEFVKGSNEALTERELIGSAAEAAGRCCHCDCRAADSCKLRHYAQQYEVDPHRYAGGKRRAFALQHQASGVIFEPGKCISCGICVALTEQAREPLGLSFVGRGFDVRVGVALDHLLAEGLQKVADACVRDCPTGALSRRDPEL